MNTASKLRVKTPADPEIVMTRVFDAPRQSVWDAMTRPELLRRWMFTPPHWSWDTCEMDVRIGGSFRWVWSAPGGEMALTIEGEYREIDEPRRIVHTERMVMGPRARPAPTPSLGSCWPRSS